ncbi:MAG TPA: hypothetical protein VFJ58_05940 [Armatimonadota bacterium]|nr:hypothetical protein [Armatimonadota bacterium]
MANAGAVIRRMALLAGGANPCSLFSPAAFRDPRLQLLQAVAPAPALDRGDDNDVVPQRHLHRVAELAKSQ